jgi:penicillin amidase
VFRRPGVRRWLIALAGLITLLLIGLVTVVVVIVRRPLPDVDGELVLQGLSGPVDVLRDGHGIPQVYADNPEDLFRAQGYVHAQDRFFEMDVRRHITAGRLSELVGKDSDALAADKVVRTLGWRKVAEDELAGLKPETRRYLEAYAEGVNGYLHGRSAGELSVNYAILAQVAPQAPIQNWTPADSVSWFKAMAWDLKTNYDDELTRARLAGPVPDVNRVKQLYPDYPASTHAPIVDLPSIVQQGSALPPGAAAATDGPSTTDVLAALRSRSARDALEATSSALDRLPELLGHDDAVGSNSWVVSGALTESNRPMLANDPHLKASAPGVWYQMGLHCRITSASCPFDVSGFTFSGMPGVIIGHNAKIGWGLTNLNADVTDFYLERVTGDSYERDGKQLPLQTRQERIEVAGGDPVTFTVRSTGHGPIVSDVLSPLQAAGKSAPAAKDAPVRGTGYEVALQWTALIPGRAMDAVFAIDTAQNWDQFQTAAGLFDSPAQNLLYADAEGHIGYRTPGRIPIRSNLAMGAGLAGDGTWPQPGWDSRFDWKGFVPQQRLPSVEDPPEGFIVAANQAVTGPGSPVVIGRDTDYGFRSQRIRDLIADSVREHRALRASDLESIQNDTRNLIAPALVPLLLKSNVDGFTAEGRDLLKGWDYQQQSNSAAAAYFNAVWAALLSLTFEDELPEGARPTGGDRWFQVVSNLLARPRDQWWDDRRTQTVVETRDEVLQDALVQARLDLTRKLGKDASRWQWGRLHRLTLQDRLLGGDTVPEPIQMLVNRGPYDAPGGASAVDAMSWDASTGSFAVTSAPSMRMVISFDDFDRSRWVNQTGASGHPASRKYDDQVGAWLEGRSYQWRFSEAQVKAATVDTLRLLPPG